MSHPADARRRWFGLLFLILAGGMLLWGQTLLKPHLRGLGYVAYWTLCLLFTFLAMFIAALDWWVQRFRARQIQRELLRQALREVEAKARDRRDTPR